jgi:hypothetical protein
MNQSKTRLVICPYCGETQPAGDRCRACRGLFEPLSRQATHNAMGPWAVRDPARPHQPGCSYETLLRMIERGRLTKHSIVRGPTTKQFWTIAKRVPGVAHVLGYCHACDADVEPDAHGCPECGAPLGAYLDRNYLGLPEVKPLPWEAPDDEDARAGGPGGDRGMWEPAPTPRGISSFASDEELRGYADAARPAAQVAEPERISRAGAESDESWMTRPAVRAMQRRIERQQRTIHVMTVIVVLVAIFAAIFNLVTVARYGRRAGAEPAGASAPRDAGGASPAAPTPPALEQGPPAAGDLGDDLETPPVGE